MQCIIMQCIIIRYNNKDKIQFNTDNTFKTYLTDVLGRWEYSNNVLKLYFDNQVYHLYYNYNNAFKNIQLGITIMFNSNNLYDFFNTNYDNITINGNKPEGYFISKFNRL